MTADSETIGDNKEFYVESISDVTIYFNGGSNGQFTSANDTATVKYINHPLTVRAWCLRPNQTVQVVSINGTQLTDPYTCVINKSITEIYDSPRVWMMVIRTTVANTLIRLRVR